MRSITRVFFLLANLASSASTAWAVDAAPPVAALASASASASANESGAEDAATGPSEEEILAAQPAEFGKFCLISGAPPASDGYTVIRKLKVGKQSYGSVRDVLPQLVGQARSLGADAMVSYNGSQRFGFFPWRLVRPVVSGTAIKWNAPGPKDCTAQGGMTVEAVLLANKAPPR